MFLKTLCSSWLLCLGLGCSHKRTAEVTQDRVKPVSELDLSDPDPSEVDEHAAAFCNPNGKQADDLRRCYEHNDALYKSFDEEAKKREPWLNFAPPGWLQATELDGKYVLPVIKEEEAVKRLETVASIELTLADAAAYTGKSFSYAGMRPYLVRALVYYKDTGTFSGFEKDQAVFIRHDSIGAVNPGERRSAVVVFLRFQPKQVYVDCQLAE